MVTLRLVCLAVCRCRAASFSGVVAKPTCIQCRKICTFAAQRAYGRLEAQRDAMEDGGVGAADERRLVLKDAARLGNVSSQIGGRRPIQGCAISPDGRTVATGDWDGVVSFWELDDQQLGKLKVSQVRTCMITRACLETPISRPCEESPVSRQRLSSLTACSIAGAFDQASFFFFFLVCDGPGSCPS